MSPELIGILSVGAALAALVFTSMHRMDKRIDALEARIAALEKGQARLEGLLDGSVRRCSSAHPVNGLDEAGALDMRPSSLPALDPTG